MDKELEARLNRCVLDLIRFTPPQTDVRYFTLRSDGPLGLRLSTQNPHPDSHAIGGKFFSLQRQLESFDIQTGVLLAAQRGEYCLMVDKYDESSIQNLEEHVQKIKSKALAEPMTGCELHHDVLDQHVRQSALPDTSIHAGPEDRAILEQNIETSRRNGR